MAPPTIKPDGTPLTSKEKKQRYKEKQEKQAAARAMRSQSASKSRAKKRQQQAQAASAQPFPTASTMSGSAGYTTDTDSSVSTTATEYSLKVPPTPPVRQPVNLNRNNIITPAALPMTPRSQSRSYEVPCTPLTQHQHGLVLKIYERKEARRLKAMEMINKGKVETEAAIALAQDKANKQTAETQERTNLALNEARQDSERQILELEEKGGEDDEACIQALVHGLPLGAIPEEYMYDEATMKPVDLKATLGGDNNDDVKPAAKSSNKQSAGNKRTSLPSSGVTPTSEPKSKRARGRPRNPPSLEIVPVFATRKLGANSENIMCFHEIYCADRNWRFNLLEHIMTIDQSLQMEKPMTRKYLLAGARDSTTCLFTQYGIPAPPDLPCGNISVPLFTVHVLEEGMPEPPFVFAAEETKSGTDILKLPIGKGKKYSWKTVGHPRLDIKILQSHWRHSATSISKMSATDKHLAENAKVWFPPPFDMNNSNPFEEFDLTVPAIDDRAEDHIVIDLTVFKKARRNVLTALIDEHLAQDPNWGSDVDTMGKRRLVWNDIYLNDDDDDGWYRDLLHPLMIDGFLEYFEEELDGVANARDLVTVEAKRALELFRPKMLDAFVEAEHYETLSKTTKHFKIYPENEELRHEILRGSAISFIHAFVGTAEDVFPKLTGQTGLEPNQPAFQDNWSFHDIPEQERTYSISADDPLNDDRATDADAFTQNAST